MRFVYNHKQYEVMELHDIHSISYMGMLALFEVQYCHYEKGTKVIDSEEDFLSQDDHKDFPIIFEELRFINHFPIDSREHQDIVDNCQYFIDHEYDKDFDQLKYLMRELRKVQYAFELDNDYYLERLDDKQYDLYEWINKNIELTQDEKDLIEWNYKYGETR